MRTDRVSTALLLFLCLASPAVSAEEQEPPTVPPSVHAVVAGGSWQDKDSSGYYRAVVENKGFEHVHSLLWLEWVVKPSPESAAVVTKRVLVKEISQGNWSLGLEDPELELAKGRLVVGATNPYTLEVQSFVLELGAPGVYRLVGHAV